MEFNEKKKNLFTVDDSYHLAHCIASDLRMSAGIAVDMQKAFGLRGKLKKSGQSLKSPTCILTGRVFNLITKKKSPGKPSYESLSSSLDAMKNIAVINGISKIAMPKIGCGRDRLSWPMVRSMVCNIFHATDIEILVCVFQK